MNHLNKDVAIFIPTFNRANFLDRLVPYITKQPFHHLIVDSSPKPSFLKNSDNIDYLHLPNLDFVKKIKIALDRVQTEYLVFCADDDFLVTNGVLTCLNFLKNNEDFVAASGRTISFQFFNNLLTYRPSYSYANDQSFSEISHSKRLVNSFRNYFPVFYAVHRRQNIIDGLNLWEGLTEGMLGEFAMNLAVVARGKFKNLPVFYHVRETNPVGNGRICRDLDFLLGGKNGAEHPDIARVRNSWSKYISKQCGLTFSESQNLLESMFMAYIDFKSNGSGSTLGSILPYKEKFLGLLSKFPSSFSFPFYYAYSSFLREKLRKDAGYPFSRNSGAAEVWQEIKAHIHPCH